MDNNTQVFPGLERKFLQIGEQNIPYYDLSSKLDKEIIENNKLWQSWGIIDNKGRYYSLRELNVSSHNDALKLLSQSISELLDPCMLVNVGGMPVDYEQRIKMQNKNIQTPFDCYKKDIVPVSEYKHSIVFENFSSSENVIITQALCVALYNVASQTPKTNEAFIDTLLHDIYGLGFKGKETIRTCDNGNSLQYKVNAKKLDMYLNDTHDEVFPYNDFVSSLNATRSIYLNDVYNRPPEQ